MEPSPAPHESPAKAADKEVEPDSVSRFTRLAKHLFHVDPEAFKEVREKDEAQRRAKRGR
jgi:uncharacterized tellurite resistance protein B-like protein